MDDDLPPFLEKQLEAYREDVQALNHMEIPKHIFDGKELHAFVDASEKAYGAAVYVRSTNKNGQISVRLLCAKSGVAVLEKQTLSRLELCAAVLGAELTDRVRQDLQLG
ncbi:uncharacterized protein [Drosophila tropicalis]|uniref:uncharacterized protein n=1 Tax=Drosophila tropicalis TaxID=46794 RepID=UPI0035AB9412